MHNNFNDEAPAESVAVFKEFDCPSCDANNPWDEGFQIGQEVRCHYCGCEFEVHANSGPGPSKIKLKEI